MNARSSVYGTALMCASCNGYANVVPTLLEHGAKVAITNNAGNDALCDGRPAIIGIGSLFGGDGHYPIAKGYSNGKFELEMGWGGDGNGWYDANTWYVGTIRH